MSKARQLANLLSADRDLADGSVTGSEINFTAYGDIVKNKPVILRSDGTVQQAGQTNTTAAFIDELLINAESSSNSYLYSHDTIIKDGLVYSLHSGHFNNSIYQRYTKLSISKLDQNNELIQVVNEANVSSGADGGVKQGFLNILPDGAIMVTMIRPYTGSSAYRSIRFTHIYTFDQVTNTLTLQSSSNSYSDFYYADWISNPIYSHENSSYWYYVTAIDYSSYVYYKLFKISKSSYVFSDQDFEAESTFGSTYGFSSSAASHRGWKTVPYPAGGTQRFQLIYQYNGNVIKGEFYTTASNVYDGTVSVISSLNNTFVSSTGGKYFDVIYDEDRTKYLFVHRTENDDLEICILNNTLVTKEKSVTIPGFGLTNYGDQKLITKDSNGKILVQAKCSQSTFSYTKRNGEIVSGTGLYYIIVAEDAVKGRLYVEDIISINTNSSGPNQIVVDENTNVAYIHDRYWYFYTSKYILHAYSTGDPFATNVVDDPTNIIGFAKNDAVDGSQVTVATDGGLVTLPNLTINNNYYVDTGGGITSNTSDVIAGKAISSSTLKIDFKGFDQLSASELDVLDDVTAGTVSGDKALVADSSGNITFPDNDRLKFGTGSDAEIYHNGTNFYLNNTTGSTYLLGDSSTVIQGSTITLETNFGENALYYNGNALYGYYNGSEKVRTDSGGIVVQGYVYPTTGIAHYADTDNRILFDTDTQTYQTGGATRMTISSTGLVNINRNASVDGQLHANMYKEQYVAVTSSTNATTVDCETGNSFSHTLSENTTFTFSNPPSINNSYTMTLEIIQDAAASGFTLQWPASVIWPSATAPTLTATASAKDVFVFSTHDGGTTWYGFTAGQALG